MTDLDAVRTTVRSVLDPLGLDLYDVVLTGAGGARTLRILVSRPGGVDLEGLADAARLVSPALDAADAVSGGRYVLEVSSPGVERPLRTAAHYDGAVGETVSLRVRGPEGTSRVRGVLRGADAAVVVVEVDGDEVRIPCHDVVGARTVFEWGPAPRPGGGSSPGRRGTRRAKEQARS